IALLVVAARHLAASALRRGRRALIAAVARQAAAQSAVRRALHEPARLVARRDAVPEATGKCAFGLDDFVRTRRRAARLNAGAVRRADRFGCGRASVVFAEWMRAAGVAAPRVEPAVEAVLPEELKEESDEIVPGAARGGIPIARPGREEILPAL